ncbi:hypothetical protein [Bacillus cereus]|uniref:hypothetical protein n=1 Tax=Bacillus cereus TaxID=1396 RepID=UPI001F393BD5|nr:hypothetical protein [Bacillus cereus]BCC15217.1 hypothetical protein BCM0074_p52 [Bacillus cereus]
MNVKEAFEILKAEGLTSNIAIVRLWIRERKLKATMQEGYRKGGYDIKEKDLEEFILSKIPPIRLEEYKRRKQLEKEKAKYKDDLELITKKVMDDILRNLEQTGDSDKIAEIIAGDKEQLKHFTTSLIKQSVKTAVEIMGDLEKSKDSK